LLVCSDILITDYSSIIYEYALLGKQMIFYSYDLTKFEKLGRGFYDDYESMVPGPVVFKTQEIVDEINNPTEYDLDEFLAKYLENCDGHARARLYDLLALDGWG
jgi:CDP-ribitol ribitolphosphotransferase